jgi:radical SAM superfamily enzyme YgiQ (UPF0313 family)
MYKGDKYHEREIAEILEDIRMARDYYGDIEKAFLCDGDAIAMDTEKLLAIIGALYASFPSLRHVGSYVGPQSTLSKSPEELRTLRAAGLTKAYIGVETGDDELLRKVKKGVGHDEMLKAGRLLVEADINLSAMVLLGLAGPGEASARHALATADIINEMKPQYLAALTVTPVPGTVLYRQVQKGDFRLLDPFETLSEMKNIFENITIDRLKFVGTHASNYLPITGTLQQDRLKMIALVDSVLAGREKNLLRPEHLRGL